MNPTEEKLRSYYEYAECDPNSEEYQQSLDIFMTLKALLKEGEINADDVLIADSVISGYSFRKTSQVLHIDRRTVTTRYHRLIKLLEARL